MSSNEDNDRFRDAELDRILSPLKTESKVSHEMQGRWQQAISNELSTKNIRKILFLGWGDVAKIAAGIAIGIGLGAAIFQKSPSQTTVQENVLASATVQYLSAKAND